MGNIIWQIPVFGAIADAAKAAPSPPELVYLGILLAVAAGLNLIYGVTTLAASIIQVA